MGFFLFFLFLLWHGSLPPRVSHSLFSEGGEWSPPLRGGDSRGGLGQVGGGNAAWNITTIGLNSIVYLMVIWRQIFSLKTSHNIAWVRIFHKLDYCKHVNSPRSGKKFLRGGGQGPRRGGTSRGGTDLTRGGMTSIVLCPPPVPPLNGKPWLKICY